MLLTTLLLSTVSANAAGAGCFNGGAFVGAQAGFMHAKLKAEAKAKAITKDEATASYKALTGALNLQTDAATTKSTAVDKDGKAEIVVDITSVTIDRADATKTAATDKAIADATATEISRLANSTDGASVKSVTSVTYKITAAQVAQAGAVLADAGFKGKVVKAVSDSLGKEDAFIAKRVAADAETKYSSNNGFAGVHAGYLGRVNDKFLVGGLVEGNWVFGQDMKVDSKAIEDTNARFNVNVFLRAMFNMTEKFMVGADVGFSGQEIRQKKSTAVVAAGTKAKSSDKESKWFWNPAARLVLGVALTENILATAHFGGVFPMMKQDSLDKSVKAKYSNFHGGVGISYAFGG